MKCDPVEMGRKGGAITGARNKGKQIFTKDQQREAQKKAGAINRQNKTGIYAITPEQRKIFAGLGSKGTKWINDGIINKEDQGRC